MQSGRSAETYLKQNWLFTARLRLGKRRVFLTVDEEEFAINTGSSIFGANISMPEDEEFGEQVGPYPQVSGLGNPPVAIRGLGAESASAPVVAPVATNSRLSAGIAVLVVAAGATAGYAFTRKKIKGGTGGFLAAAGARNLWTAKKSLDAKDVGGGLQIGFIGLIGLGIGGYLLYSASSK